MRHKFLEFLYQFSAKGYILIFKRKREKWPITIKSLSEFEEGTLGKDLYNFLDANNLEIQQKLETHDIYHVLTKTPIDVPSEIAMQYYVRGNGKKSIYSIITVLIGTVILPEEIPYFKKSFKKGKKCNTFHNIDWKAKLNHKTDDLRSQYKIVPIKN